jgi:hypothetical protein
MKTLKIISLFLVLILFLAGSIAFAEEETEGVIVFGLSEEESSDSAIPAGYDDNLGVEGMGNPEGRQMLEIKGSRIGDVVVSKPVTLSKKGYIAHVDTGLGHAFTIVQVDEYGRERQVLGLDSLEQAVGWRLPAGIYKVYPDKVEDGLNLGEINVIVQIEFVKEEKEEGE